VSFEAKHMGNGFSWRGSVLLKALHKEKDVHQLKEDTGGYLYDRDLGASLPRLCSGSWPSGIWVKNMS